MSDKEDDTQKPVTEPLDEEALEKLAVEELMREAVQGAARAEIIGPSGWVKVPHQKTNKRFLVNTLRNAVASNKYRSRSSSRHSGSRSPKRQRESNGRDKYIDRPINKDKYKRKH